MRRFAGRFPALARTDTGCAVLICILVLAAYLPTIIFRVSANPVYLVSDLTSMSRRGVTPGWPWIDPNAGFHVQALGGFAANEWLHGRIPWWDPYMGAGVPLAAEMQPAALFLPFVLLLHFWSGVVLLKIALQMVAGVATFGLLRQLQLGRLASFCGAAIYALSGTFAWFADSPIMPVAFLPLLLLGIERAFARAERRQRGGWIFIAIALAYSLYAGFPETAYIQGLLALAWSVYRFVISPRDRRLAFAGRIVTGGVVGLLLAAPLVVPFLEYQQASAIRHSGYAHMGLQKIGLAAFLLPYVFGPLHAFESFEASGMLADSMGNSGGYFDLALLFLSIAAVFAGRRMRGLRILLMVWIAVFAARTLQVRWAEDLLGFIPPLDFAQVFHYSEPTWEMSGAVLAAFLLDAWRRGIRQWPVFVGAISAIAIVAVALGLSSDLITELARQAPHYSKWFWGSVLWGVGITCILTVVLLLRPGRIFARVAGALVIVNAVALFGISELAGTRNAKVDLGPVAFLRQHLGLQRMYTFLPIAPNYGSYFRVASINHNAVPISVKWMQYVNEFIDPAVDAHVFTGYLPGPLSAREDAFRAHLNGFENAAVKYVVTPPGENPFAVHVPMSGTEGGNNVALPLRSGEQISGSAKVPPGPFHHIAGIGVVIGTYGGAASGSLETQVCVGSVCASGLASLAGAPDNQSFYIPVNPPVPVSSGSTIQYRLTHVDNPSSLRKHEVCIWLWPSHGKAQYSPRLTLVDAPSGALPFPVYHSTVADIYELPHPASYFETTGGPCLVSASSRESLNASCKTPAVLIRRELDYPGWRAYVNGNRRQIRPQSIFQTVDLPAGDSQVRFAYSPSHIGWCYLAMALGVFTILAQLAAGKMQRSPKWKAITALESDSTQLKLARR